MNTLVCSANSFTVYSTLFNYLFTYSIAANESNIAANESHIFTENSFRLHWKKRWLLMFKKYLGLYIMYNILPSPAQYNQDTALQ